MTTNENLPVVVGVDGSTTAGHALRWAVDDACRRGVPLQIVHAWQMPVLGEIPDSLVLERVPYERDAQGLLDGAVACARRLAPSLTIEPKLARDDAAPALLDAGRDGAVLVVGSHGRGRVGSAVVGSVSQRCATHATFPVVVVPAGGPASGEEGRVVVGVDGSDCSYGALHFAAAEATRRGARLDIVNVWHQAEPVSAMTAPWWPYDGSVEKASHALVEAMAEPVRPRTAGRPGPLSVEPISIEGYPSRALVSCAHGADLLVVGARGRGGFAGLLLGSISQRCLHHAPGPVAVVHLPAPA